MYKRMNKSALSMMLCLIMLLTLFTPLNLNTSFLDKTAHADGLIETTGENGRLVVYLLKDGKWIEVGGADFNEFLSEESIDLSTFLTNEESVRVKLIKNGGGSAHLDYISLGDSIPYKASENEEEVLRKITSKDLDLINIDEESIELVFPASRNNNVLSIVSRIESKNISKEPFKFPSSNNFKGISQYSEFYTYKLDSQLNSLAIDGMIDEVSGMRPLFKEYCTPGSGHPAGYTYGWVMNDDEYLYVVMDFTPDNTMDGDKDYGKVYIKTDSRVKEFKVSVPEATWGKPGFIYTDKIGYQHKVYEFKIPLSELDINNNVIALAFSAYGTAALRFEAPSAAYDLDNNRYLLIFSRTDYQGSRVCGQFIDSVGEKIDTHFNIFVNNPEKEWCVVEECKVVFDSDTDRYLVTWHLNSDNGEMIIGHYLNSNGDLLGESFTIAEAETAFYMYDIACDENTGDIIAVWSEYGVLSSRIIHSDGSLSVVKTNIEDFNTDGPEIDNHAEGISVVCDEEDRFLLVFDVRSYSDSYEESYDIYGLFIDEEGELLDSTFIISDAEGDQVLPDVGYNEDKEEFLVIWKDGRDGHYYDYYLCVYGRTVNSMQELSAEYEIFNRHAENDEYSVLSYDSLSLVYNPVMDQYMILTQEEIYGIWYDGYDSFDDYPEDLTSDTGIYIQHLSSDIELINDRTLVGETNTHEFSFEHPVTVCNTNLGNYIVAYMVNWFAYEDDWNRGIYYHIIPEVSDLASTIEFSSPSYDAYEDEGEAEITITRTGNLDTVASVVYRTEDYTAVNGEDYVGTTGTITFEPGIKKATITVPIINDDVFEEDETLDVILSDVDGGELGEIKISSLNILNDDEEIYPTENTLEFSSSNYTVDEGNKDVAITVKLNYAEVTPYLLTQSEEEQSVITVVYSAYDNTAKSGEDYYSTSGILTFENGETEKSFIVTIKDDNVYEGSEIVDLTLSSPIGAILGSQYNAMLTIKDNDSKPSSGGGGVSSKKPETPPPTEKLPDGSLIDRMKGYIVLSEPTKITSVKKEIKLSYDEKLLEKNPEHSPRIYYWNAEKENWVALASYDAGKGKITAINDGEYSGWFTVFGVLQPEFSDLDDYWAEEIINRMNGLGMIEGYKTVEDDSIRVALPENNVTWAEFTMFIARILNIDIDDHLLPDISFKEARSILEPRYDDYDKIPDWVFNAVAVVEDADILPENRENFESSTPINRIEAAVMISRALNMIEEQEIADLKEFKDYEDIPEWARKEIAEGVIEGYPDKTFKPNDNLSRAEALTMLYRLFVQGLGW